ncbi:MAG: type III polyketide synthase [Legionella sp.]|nr:type III polyketide synthase [Legionella sp.]
MNTGITAIGTALPQYQRNQDEIGELISSISNLTNEQKKTLRAVYRATGIKKRYSVLSDFCRSSGSFTFFPNDINASFPTTAQRMEIYKANALELALKAIDDCMNQIGFDYSEITHLITVSCTGMYAPGIDIEIVQKLKLNKATKRTTINFMGCYGAFNGIKVADAFSRTDPKAKVLVVCVELCTIHFQRAADLSNLISNAIFSDGAAAVIIEANPEGKLVLGLESFFCSLLPNSENDMAWHVGDQGFDMILSSYIPALIKSGISTFAEQLLEKTKLAIFDIDYFAIHPGGQKILEACEIALNISKEDNQFSYKVMQNYGNMSSATVLFVLKEIWNNLQRTDDGKTIFSCAFGPGLTLESILLKVNNNYS